MKRRLASRALLAVMGAAWLLAPAGPAAAGEKPVEPPSVTVVPANDEERKQVLDLVARAEQEHSNEVLLQALGKMQARKCADYLPVLKKLLDDEDPAVQAAAISAAASNEMKDEEKHVRKLLHTKPKGKVEGGIAGGVAAACIDYLTRLGIAGEEDHVLSECLKETVGDERRLKQPWALDLIRNGLTYLAKMKCKRSVPWLIDDMLPIPAPANPNDPKNPPATYWQLRTTLHQTYEGWVRWVLKELTGQEFRSQREWQAWLKQQDKKQFK